MASKRRNLPFSSDLTDLSSKSSVFRMSMATPRLWGEPWAKKKSPRYCDFHWFSISLVLYVSWRKQISAFCLVNQLKIPFLFANVRMPRTLRERELSIVGYLHCFPLLRYWLLITVRHACVTSLIHCFWLVGGFVNIITHTKRNIKEKNKNVASVKKTVECYE